jgi:ElaB/YqjD/DUF883 family membrane-anchored ribosome-binding protein
MENEPEVTRHQMEDTRASLSEKLETLEQRVVDTMQGATTAVADTVDNIKDAVHETMETVKDTFNLNLQVMRRPWSMVAGSMAFGCLGGYLLFRRRSARPMPSGWSQPPPPDSSPITGQRNGAVKRHRSVEETAGFSHGPPALGWLSGVNQLFGSEIDKLKGLLIGKALSVVRDLITRSVSEPMKAPLVDVMDSVMVKLGGEPTRGPVTKESSCAREEEHPARDLSEMRRL